VSEGPVYRLAHDGEPLPANPSQLPFNYLRASVIRGYLEPGIDARTRRLVLGDFAVHHNAVGVAEEEAKHYPQALDWYRRAARLDPDMPEYYFNQGNVYFELKNLEKAVVMYQVALSKDPQFQPALYNLAALFYQTGQRGLAVEKFKALLALDPGRQDVKAVLQQLGVSTN
jgi:tetratricopeptide (TPR) repeat protein